MSEITCREVREPTATIRTGQQHGGFGYAPQRYDIGSGAPVQAS
jgi:hypothetical protein